MIRPIPPYGINVDNLRRERRAKQFPTLWRSIAYSYLALLIFGALIWVAGQLTKGTI